MIGLDCIGAAVALAILLWAMDGFPRFWEKKK
jgi:hypothetical protein